MRSCSPRSRTATLGGASIIPDGVSLMDRTKTLATVIAVAAITVAAAATPASAQWASPGTTVIIVTPGAGYGYPTPYPYPYAAPSYAAPAYYPYAASAFGYAGWGYGRPWYGAPGYAYAPGFGLRALAVVGQRANHFACFPDRTICEVGRTNRTGYEVRSGRRDSQSIQTSRSSHPICKNFSSPVPVQPSGQAPGQSDRRPSLCLAGLRWEDCHCVRIA